jgi:hypothetical protein
VGVLSWVCARGLLCAWDGGDTHLWLALGAVLLVAIAA